MAVAVAALAEADRTGPHPHLGSAGSYLLSAVTASDFHSGMQGRCSCGLVSVGRVPAGGGSGTILLLHDPFERVRLRSRSRSQARAVGLVPGSNPRFVSSKTSFFQATGALCHRLNQRLETWTRMGRGRVRHLNNGAPWTVVTADPLIPKREHDLHALSTRPPGNQPSNLGDR